MKKWNLNPKL